MIAALQSTPWTVWGVAALATAGVITRPFSLPEFIWAVAGAVLLVLFGLLPLRDAWTGVAKGGDVYMFLAGMMLLSELARTEGLFDWLASHAARSAHGSASRLFALVFAVGTVVTVFLSNDATAVVLTPAVAAVAGAAQVRNKLPYLLVCAFIANAASFVLPISNPANLVIYGSHMPPLLEWLPRFGLPSVAAIAATFVVLRLTQRESLREEVSQDVEARELSSGGLMAAFGIAVTAAVLLLASGFGLDLGLPTLLAGLGTALLVMARSRQRFGTVLAGISWGVLPLVAGLFVLVEAVERTGLVDRIAAFLHAVVEQSAALAFWGSGLVLAVACNLLNNLPAGLVAGRVVEIASVPDRVRSAVLIAVDLGPNLSVTGSLATILWLIALRREGVQMDAWAFLRLGVLVMTPALLLSLAAAYVLG